MSNQLFLKTINSPIGTMIAITNDTGICLLEFKDRKELNSEIEVLKDFYSCSLEEKEENELLKTLTQELALYFEGKLQQFSTPITLIGTGFQKTVWKALLDVPYGTTRTYKEQSIVVGDLKAIRAVASANGKNKLAILVPCHRIIGSDGNLTGYAGGLDRKRLLLNLERKIAGPKDLFS